MQLLWSGGSYDKLARAELSDELDKQLTVEENHDCS